MEALRLAQIPSPPPPSVSALDTSTLDRTAITDAESDLDRTTITSAPPPKGILKKKPKPKLSAKEKKERALEIERMVVSLPLEFRGSEPTLRRHVEMVIEGFLERGRGVGRTSCFYILSSHLLFGDKRDERNERDDS